MPDRDIIHPTLNWRFQNVYGQICEGHWDSSELGYKMLHPLKGQIKEYSNAPIVMGQSIVPILQGASSLMGDNKRSSFANASNQITELSKNPNMNCSPRGRDIMVAAAKKILIRIQGGESIADVELALYKTYADTVYEKDCESRIHAPPKHYKDASPLEVRQLMNDIRPYVERGQDEFAKQLVKYKDVSKLRRPRRLKERALKIDDSAW